MLISRYLHPFLPLTHTFLCFIIHTTNPPLLSAFLMPGKSNTTPSTSPAKKPLSTISPKKNATGTSHRYIHIYTYL